MIQFRIGNLLESNAQALVNTVNTDGKMGKVMDCEIYIYEPNYSIK